MEQGIGELWSERWELLHRVLFQKKCQVWVDISSTGYSSQNENEFTHFEEAS